MKRMNCKSMKIVAAILVLAMFVTVSLAVFTDRETATMQFTTATFSSDGYTLTREAPTGPFIAGEDVTVKLFESNTRDEDINSVITMTVGWNSPDANSKIFGNANASDNATIKITGDGLDVDGVSINYTVNTDGTITFSLPTHLLAKGSSNLTRELTFHIPESLKATGSLDFKFDKVNLEQAPAGFKVERSAAELNAQEKLNFSVNVGWAASANSANNGKNLMGYLTSDAKGIEFKHEFGTTTNAMKDFSSGTASKWSYYRDSITKLIFVDGMTSIGDYGFTNFAKVTSITLPGSVTTIGTSAFDGTGLSGELIIPATVKNIESLAFGNLPNVTTITFKHASGDQLTLPTNSNKDGAFFVGAPYTPTAPLGTKVNTNLSGVLDYAWPMDSRGFTVTVETVDHGSMTASPNVAINGKTITLNPTPDTGYGYDGATVKYTESGTEKTVSLDKDKLTFVMPAANVTVTPKWKIITIPMLAPQDTWQYVTDGEGNSTTSIDFSILETINIVNTYEPDGTEASWDASAYETVNGKDYMGKVTAYLSADKKTLTLAGNGYGCIYANPDSSYAFSYLDSVTTMSGTDILNTSEMVNADSMFLWGENIAAIDVSNWDVSSLVYASRMFAGCSTLTELDVGNWNTCSLKFSGDYNHENSPSYVPYMGMFAECYGLTTLDVATKTVNAGTENEYTAWDMSNVISTYGMFYACENLTTVDVSDWDTGNMETAGRLFARTAITTVDVSDWNVGNLVIAESMFSECPNFTGIDVSQWNVKSLEDVSYMFEECPKLVSMDFSTWDESVVNVTERMFYKCTGLTSVILEGWNLSNLELSDYTTASSGSMFEYCSSLQSLTIPESLTKFGRRFAAYCPALTEITFKHAADTELVFPTEGKSYGAFYVSSPYTSTAPLGTKVVADNTVVLDYSWKTDARGFTVTVETVAGGTMAASPTVSINGKTITLNPTPDTGYAYNGATVSYTDEAGKAQTIALDKDTVTFKMPVANVTVTPAWKISAIPMLAASDSWQYVTDGEGNPVSSIDYALLETINIVPAYEPDGTETSWDASANETVDGVEYKGKVTAYLSADKKTLTIAGNGNDKIYANPDSTWAFSSWDNWGFAALTKINGAEYLDTGLVTDAGAMFSMNEKLEYVNVSNWDTSNIQYTNYNGYYGMFMNCYKLKDLDVATKSIEREDGTTYTAWDTGSMIETIRMFSNCQALTAIDVSDWDMSTCESTADMFSGAAISEIAVDDWNTSNLYYSYGMFDSCANLKEINLSKWDVSKLEDTSEMFCDSGLTKIDLSAWDESVVSCTYSMFDGCEDLTQVNIVGWNLSNLESVNTNDTYKSSYRMFADCTSLETLTLPASLKVFARDFAKGCTSLKTIEFKHDASANDLFFANAGSSYGAFFVDTPYSSTAPLRTKVITNNASILNYGWDKDNRGYTISIETVTGGTLKANPNVAINGKTVTLTPTATGAYAYDGATVTYTESGTENTIELDKNTKTFTMPVADVTITPKWSMPAAYALILDNSGDTSNAVPMIFVRETEAPKVGDTYVSDTYGALPITAVYTGFEDANYTNPSSVPWYSKRTAITGVVVEDAIAPISTESWFYEFKNCTALDLTKLDTSIVTNMSKMFRGAWENAISFTLIGIENWDTSSVTDMSQMFYKAGYKATTFELDLSRWNTSSVTNMNWMFYNTGYNATTFTLTGLENWDTSSVTIMATMFSSAGRNATTWDIGDLSNWDISKVTNMSQMFYNAGYKATTWDIGDLSNWDISSVTTMESMFYNAGYNATTWDIGDLSTKTITRLDGTTYTVWDTSSVTNMSQMFYSAGYNATTWDIGDLSNWDISKVTNMSYMFSGAGYKATTWDIGDLSGWDTANVTNMNGMFQSAGYSATTWDIGDLSGWDTSSVTKMFNMFAFAGYNATSFTLTGLDQWDTSNVTTMEGVFSSAGRNATSFELDLSGWNVGKVTTMYQMFYSAGYNATTWDIGDLSNWDTSSVTTMQQMFYNAGYKATTWDIGDLSGWETSSVTNMYSMFEKAGYSSNMWDIGDLSNWDTSSVTKMFNMFSNAGYKATSFELDLSGWDTSSVTDMSSMFSSAGYSATTWSVGDLSGWDTANVTNMNGMFSSAGYKATYTLDLTGWNVGKVTSYKNFNQYVATKVLAPAFGTTAASLSLTPALELPEGVTTGEAQSITAMPDITALNSTASGNAPENTVLYGWLVDSGMAKQIVQLADFEAALDSVYAEEPAWEMTITPLYQEVQEPESEPSQDENEPVVESKTSEEPPSADASEPTEGEDSEPSESSSEDEGTSVESTETESGEEAISKEGEASAPSDEPEATEPGNSEVTE